MRGTHRLTVNLQPSRAKVRWDRDFARSVVIVACVGLALLVAGCDPTRDSRYLREGIGTDLYWDGLPASTQLQDIYLANICSQALSRTARSIDTVSCDGLSLTPRDWGLLVQAGMNDIDLRCDAYLSWLYDRKSSKEPFLKELASIGGAAAGILKATDAGSTPIALTAIAFGLAAETFTNIDLRLVNAVDYTTVDSVVRDNRTRFRVNNLDLVIDNRPAAIYVLRNYLSICVPDSIEMSINNTVTVYHRGGPDALRMPPIGLRTAPATSATSAAVRGAVISDVRKRLPSEDFRPAGLDAKDIFNAQVEKALCVSQTGETKDQAVTNFLVGRGLVDPSSPQTAKVPKLNQLLKNVAADVSDCKKNGFRNAFEVGRYGATSDYPKGQVKLAIGELQDALRKKIGMQPTALPNKGELDSATRTAISDFRNKNNFDKQLGDQVDNKLYLKVTEP
ncbi:hypothetical protein SAMN05444169_3311 [Bradyrhizobium erythrophlei]|uniref:Uncharacterized protein n=1 Tax=Bradyrhizobium erythrophlei TaxID=1437360 RepID=A0A1M5L980_9BRAD|nr:hypothetical protein SAMN05444169_3311 [Bradyrhizobium erythrophlei]